MAAKFAAKPLLSRGANLVEPRSALDLQNMALVVRLKREQHPDVAEHLRATGDATLVEDTSRRRPRPDVFWGAARVGSPGLPDDAPRWRDALGDVWVGLNFLGRTWSEQRVEGRLL